ncbi:DNA-3-methyladenine glycosylase [Salimicrobium sp. PL1-032A]|uniref:DNA-3-methyladenine glycosylase n=1 Tax=Salimicrobium sp. PL1-032A TaxID=3095364 RepID=UPI0032605318
MELMTKEFFEQPTLTLAEELLGCELIKETEAGITSGYIVETEAYIGAIDPAAHSFDYKRTKRTEIMFKEPGLAYTYVMHTHCLVNVVTGEPGEPEAILIRAIEPVQGIDLMYDRRGDKKEKDLTNGPGKLTKAMGIDKADYGHPFGESPLYIAKGFTPENISTGPRVGIENSGEARHFPWRFWVTGNKFVSR